MVVVLVLRERWWVWESILGDDTDDCREGLMNATLQELWGRGGRSRREQGWGFVWWGRREARTYLRIRKTTSSRRGRADRGCDIQGVA